MLFERVAAAALFIFCGAGVAFASAQCRPDLAQFQTKDGVRGFTVEIADDEAERARGLMYRRELAPDAGMLFIYDTPREVSFWMRNTYIPLDLIFMDDAGVIRHIHRNAKPFDETPLPGANATDPAPKRLMVLEIAAGQADLNGLNVGQPMAHPRLDQAHAKWGCR